MVSPSVVHYPQKVRYACTQAFKLLLHLSGLTSLKTQFNGDQDERKTRRTVGSVHRRVCSQVRPQTQ